MKAPMLQHQQQTVYASKIRPLWHGLSQKDQLETRRQYKSSFSTSYFSSMATSPG